MSSKHRTHDERTLATANLAAQVRASTYRSEVLISTMERDLRKAQDALSGVRHYGRIAIIEAAQTGEGRYILEGGE